MGPNSLTLPEPLFCKCSIHRSLLFRHAMITHYWQVPAYTLNCIFLYCWSVDPTQPTYKSRTILWSDRPNPTQANPTHRWTQPMHVQLIA